jgi:hypothetical protein
MLSKFAPLAAVVVFGVCSPAYAQDGKNPRGVNPTHYQCYSVKAPENAQVVKLLRDQFGVSEAVKLANIVFLCAPAAKNGVAARDQVTHYLCYEEERDNVLNKKVRVTNQLTKETGIELLVETPKLLCVPSIKKLLEEA